MAGRKGSSGMTSSSTASSRFGDYMYAPASLQGTSFSKSELLAAADKAKIVKSESGLSYRVGVSAGTNEYNMSSTSSIMKKIDGSYEVSNLDAYANRTVSTLKEAKNVARSMLKQGLSEVYDFQHKRMENPGKYIPWK